MKHPVRSVFLCMTVWMAVLPASARQHRAPDLPQERVQSVSLHDGFRQQVYVNPASHFFRQDYSLTTLGLTAREDKVSTSRFGPFGRGGRAWGFDTRSYYLIEKDHRVWGEAAFHKGVRKDVRWSETSDYELLYPYIMADEFGGRMDYEQYDLNGGYAGRCKRWVFGAQMGYRARSEYRTRDPRPNNTVADLQARLGVGYVIGNYEIALAASAGKYKQTNELKYFNELGASKEYHLTGIGTEYFRFSGACNNVFYRGHHFGGSLELTPSQHDGLSASLLYDRFEFDKVLNDLNHLALNHVDEHTAKAEIAWSAPISRKGCYGVKGEGIYAQRNGYDHLFGSATGNVYPQIGEIQMFESRRLGGRLEAFFEQRIFQHYQWGISAFGGLYDINSSHEESGNRFDTRQMVCGGTLQGNFSRKRNFIQLSIEGDIRKGMGTQLQMDPDLACHIDLAQQLSHLAYYLRGGEAHGSVNLHYEFKLRPSTLSYFVEASWGHRLYLNRQHHDNRYFLTTGVRL